MRSRVKIFIAFTTFAVLIAASAYAGKVELTTYYPAPSGEYENLQASTSLKVPMKPVNNDTSAVDPGEIWVEGACPTGTWNGKACV